MRLAPDEPLCLHVGDQRRRVRRVDAQDGGELAHRHRLARQPAQRAAAAEAHAQRVGDLAPPLVVEHEVGHQQPDLACWVLRHAASASGLSSAAVRLADAPARVVVATTPSAKTAAPQAASSHQAGWLAVVRDVPAWEATIAPITATPSVWPTWREVVAIAAATPAWARGIPDTAAFVIGALTRPKPIPNST